MDSGVATRPIEDLAAYKEKLNAFVFRTTLLMKPVFERAKTDPQRVVYAEGEEEVVLRAVQHVVDEGMARPILIGRPSVIESRIQRLNLRLQAGRDFELCSIESDPRFKDYWTLYHELMARRGIARQRQGARPFPRDDHCRAHAPPRRSRCADLRRRRPLSQETRLFARHHPDAAGHAESVRDECGVQRSRRVLLRRHARCRRPRRRTHRGSRRAALRLKLFGIQPKIAVLSHSNFGSHDDASAQKMRQVVELLRERLPPKIEIDGEMHADTALNPEIRAAIFPNSKLTGTANLFICPNMDSANIAFNMTRVMTDGVVLGPCSWAWPSRRTSSRRRRRCGACST
jgi:malate dehydrogenase (oxaloacetate-decarboxylating)(NADP+)